MIGGRLTGCSMVDLALVLASSTRIIEAISRQSSSPLAKL